MKQIIILCVELLLILGLAAALYYLNLSRKSQNLYTYQKPLIYKKFDLSDQELKKEINLFLSRELNLFGGDFQVMDAVSLSANDISGADYIMVTVRAPDGKICQVTLSRSLGPWSKWEINPTSLNVIEAPQGAANPAVKIPKWMDDLGATSGQLQKYYATHPEFARKGEAAFFNTQTGKYELPADWHQSVMTVVTGKDKALHSKVEAVGNAEADEINNYWKPDYSTEYTGLGYRGYLYRKIKGSE